MTRDFDQAVAQAQARRKALRATVDDLRGRLSPPQLAEDALSLIDPELSLLARFKARIESNRLLSLAVLAGVGWLVGAPRHHDGEPRGAGEAGTPPHRVNLKEKKNDSGQIHGDQWTGTGAGRQEERRPEELPETAAGPRRGRKARQVGGGTPLEREPQQHPRGERDEGEEQQPVAERPQQQP